MTSLFGSDRRLHLPSDFSAVLSTKRVIRGTQFDLHIKLTEVGSLTRLGLVVPKKLAKAASLRNAIKRQGREAFRLYPLRASSFDLVLRLCRPVKGVRANDKIQKMKWRLDIESLLNQLSI